MTRYLDIGAYDAKTHFSGCLKKVQAGMAFRITNRGEPVADLVPPGEVDRRRRALAAERMKQFIQAQPQGGSVDIKALIEEGRD